MNSMQWSVAILGGVALVGVLAYNWWAMKRAQPRQATPNKARKGKAAAAAAVEPMLDDMVVGEREPGLDLGGDFTDAPHTESATSAQAADASAGGLPLPHVQLATEAVLDALIDAIVPIALSGPVSGDAVLAAMPATRRVGSKSLVVECQGDDGEWERPQPEHRYQGLQVGLQLANRSGAINNIEFSEFVAKVQHLADALGGAPDFPDMLSEVARARELDVFASEHDAQLGLVLRARGTPWSVGFVQHHAAQLGVVTASPGRLVLPGRDASQAPLVTLRFDTRAALDDENASGLRELRLVLDVPQVPREAQPFEHMVDLALHMAKAMQADIVDDVGQALPEETLVQIGQELAKLYDALDQRDLSAGSVLARRLFS